MDRGAKIGTRFTAWTVAGKDRGAGRYSISSSGNSKNVWCCPCHYEVPRETQVEITVSWQTSLLTSNGWLIPCVIITLVLNRSAVFRPETTLMRSTTMGSSGQGGSTTIAARNTPLSRGCAKSPRKMPATEEHPGLHAVVSR